jgi:hypothetical protein
MFKALLTVQWKWTRGIALLGLIFGFAIPLASVQFTSEDAWGNGVPYIVARMQEFGIVYALLAAGVGLAVALVAWSADHRGRHVYALSLPVNRSRYAAMRFGAGALFLLLPAAGVLLGSLLALAISNIPDGLHGYPISLTVRFLLASLVAYSIFFAVSSSTPRVAGYALMALALLIVTSSFLSAASINAHLLGHVGDFVFSEPGPLSVFTGRWMLIDA